VEYIKSRSLWLDIKLLFKTVPAVLLGKGAY
jgi:lipopolysaccharide/colanic/teichoic acid biosynthesis glycosyltransferase